MLIVWSLVLLTLLGIVFAVGLSFASKKFRVDADPRIEQITELLPGANCGGCGFAGCAAAAEAVVKGDSPANVCPALNAETAKKVAAIMGVEYVEREPEIAVVRCQGTGVQPRFHYFGVQDCRAAALVQGGPHGCSYGCLGFGTCVEACPFEAMRMRPDGLPEAIPERCTGCGKCAQVCPRGLIRILPASKRIHVLCRSHDKGGIVKKICAQGCIGCKKCEKECPYDAIHVTDFVAEIDYEKCKVCGKCIKACPVGVIVNIRKKKKTQEPGDKPEAGETAEKEETAAVM